MNLGFPIKRVAEALRLNGVTAEMVMDQIKPAETRIKVTILGKRTGITIPKPLHEKVNIVIGERRPTPGSASSAPACPAIPSSPQAGSAVRSPGIYSSWRVGRQGKCGTEPGPQAQAYSAAGLVRNWSYESGCKTR